MKVGKVYVIRGGNPALLFGLVPRTAVLSEDVEYDGIGVDLETKEVITVDYFISSPMHSIDQLTPDQLINLGHYMNSYQRLRNSVILSISGKARSGKDTLAGYVSGKLNYSITALGDPIKRTYTAIFGNTEKKDRENLIMIGQGLRREDNHVWVKAWLRKAIVVAETCPEPRLIVTDVRQPNEFIFLSSLGAYTVRIDSNEDKRRKILVELDGEGSLAGKLLNGETESHLESFGTDLTIYNNYDVHYESSMDYVIEGIKSRRIQ